MSSMTSINIDEGKVAAQDKNLLPQNQQPVEQAEAETKFVSVDITAIDAEPVEIVEAGPPEHKDVEAQPVPLPTNATKEVPNACS